VSGLVFKTTSSNGNQTDRSWAFNRPPGGNTSENINPYVKTEYTTIADANGNPSITSIKDYSVDPNGNQTEVREYDWVAYTAVPKDPLGAPTGIPSGAVLKRKTTSTFNNSATIDSTKGYWSATAPNVRNAASSVEIRDGNNTLASRSELVYDVPETTANVTQNRAWNSLTGGYITTSTAYDPYGNPTLLTDANGNQTQITYGSINGFTGLYPTQTITASQTAVARTSSAVYDFYTGAVTTATDIDNNVSTVTEYDALGRPTKVRTASGTSLESWALTTYDDLNRRVIVKTDLNALGDGKKVATQFFDQLGRVRLSKTLEDAAIQSATDEIAGLKVQTRYMTSGGYTYQLTSNPYRAGYSSSETDPTMGWTRSLSVNTGRHAETETFSGAALPAPWGGNASSTGKVQTDIDANATTVTDQAGKQRRSISNGLGQLTRVDEPTASGLGSVTAPNQPTYYAYDTLGNMITVQQGAQSRFFLYSSLGRLLRVRQPEQDVNNSLALSGHPANSSWTAGFTYDNNGNVLTTTDARNVTVTNNSYDALNRPASRSYNDSVTPTVNFYYDGNGVTPTPSFAKGKLTKVTNGVSESRYTQFDAVGRLLQYQQFTDSNTYTSSYIYSLSGALQQETYPSGRVVQNQFAANGDLATVNSKKSGAAVFKPYVSNFVYTAAGGVSQMKLGNGRWETAKFNNLLQVTELGLGTSATDTSLWKTGYEYGELQGNGTVDASKNAGNIAKQTLTIPGTSFVQAYTYDSLDRLTQAKETTGATQNWIQNFGYDLYGNRTSFSQNIGGNTTATNPSINASTNRFNTGQGFSYDANGNVVNDVDPVTGHARQFTLNGDNKQTQVKDTSSNTTKGTYYYDGEGKRVKKITETETTIFVYSTGKLVAEYSTANLPSNPAINYTTTDHLGTPRVITDDLGQVKARRDFLPFGEELFVNVGPRSTGQGYGSTTDNVRQKFTGYQKDTETGLDFAEARMYENRFGRFTAVDPLMASGKSADPQTFNRYVYVGNKPVRTTDTRGLDWWDVTNSAGKRDIAWFDDDPDEDEYKVNGRWTNYVYRASDNNWYALDPESSSSSRFFDENAAKLQYGKYTDFKDLDYLACNLVGCKDVASLVANMRTGDADGAIYDFGKISVINGVGGGIGRYLASARGVTNLGLNAFETESAANATTALIPKATASLGRWGEAQLGNLLGGVSKNSKPLATSLGNRVNDFIVDGIAYEAKAGVNVGLTSSIRTQILKDVELIAKNQIRGAEWHFYQGAQQEVLDFLANNRIKAVVH
jgi:RHS repeat-associated protein